MPAVESRYAEALLAALPDSAAAESACAFLGDFAGLLAADGDLRGFMLSPVVPGAAKKEVFAKLLPSGEQSLLLHFLYLLTDRARLAALGGIYERFKRLMEERGKRLDIVVLTAFPLSQEQLEAIKEKYTKKYGSSSASVTEKIEPGLIGGVQVQIGDIRINDSVRSRLSSLRSAIMEQ